MYDFRFAISDFSWEMLTGPAGAGRKWQSEAYNKLF